MTKDVISQENQVLKARKPETQEPVKQVDGAEKTPHGPAEMVGNLQRIVGNRAVQRMLVQRSGDGPFELDDDTAGKINQQRGGGQALDNGVQRQMGSAMGQDFSGVRVHTSGEAHDLNEQVGAVAFTTGSDIFFREGAYNPSSSGGQELLAHELTHVVQQSSGEVSGGQKMTVNAPNDSYEQEADAVAKSAMSQPVQRAAAPEEEETLQGKRLQRQEEEEEVQMKRLQRQEEEEEVQMKRLQRQPEEEEEPLQGKLLQRDAVPEEEEVQTKRLQREAAPEEEEIQTKRLQREAAPEEEEIQTKRLQRHTDEDAHST